MEIRPFCAYRPPRELADKIAALPYDVFNRKEAEAYVQKHPLSFLRIDRAETGMPAEVDTYDPSVYARARKLFEESIQKGEFVRDDSPCYYLYELTMEGRSQTGIVAVCPVEEYLKGNIRRHENTREDKEQDRIRHVDALNAQTGPIFLAYREREELSSLIAGIKEKETPEQSFVSEDGIGHKVWVIRSGETLKELKEKLSHIERLYIADGHHRAASAVKVALMRRAEHPEQAPGQGEYDYFLSVLFPDRELKIYDYNRVVKDLNGLSAGEFLERLKQDFLLGEPGEESVRPGRKGEFGLFLEGKWRKLTYKGRDSETDPVEALDVSILQNRVLEPLLGIRDPKTDKRIDFIGGIRGLSEIERRCREDMQVGFSMYPTSMEELFSVSDAERLMPPKSTWFEPKLLSGLFIHSLEPAE